MASIDYAGDISRIITILQSHLNLWDTSNPDGKLNAISFGEQRGGNQDKATIAPPFAVITTPSQPFITKDSLGIGDNSSDPQSTVLYEIKVFAEGSLPEDAEKNLYDFIREIVDTLRANPRGKDPISLGDPKWTRSFVKDVAQNQTNRGKPVQSATITIQCQIGDSIQLVYDGMTISVLEEASSPHGWTTQNKPDDDGLADVVPISLEEKKFFKIETNPTLQSALRAKLRLPGYRAATITRNGIARNITLSMLTNLSEISIYDQIQQAVIAIAIIRDTS